MSQESTRRADLVRVVIVVVSAVLGVAGAFVGSGALGGTPIADAAGGALSADATPVAPAGPAFAIWTPIYAGLLAYAVYQALPGTREAARLRATGYPVAASLLLNAAWILAVQADLLILTLPIIVVLLVVLLIALRRAGRRAPASAVEAVVVDGTLGLYLGWVTVATVANAAAVLAASGFVVADAAPWSVSILALAGLVGAATAWWTRGRLAPAAATVWGLAWIAVGRIAGEPSSTPAAVAAIAAGALVVVVVIIARVRRARTARGSSA